MVTYRIPGVGDILNNELRGDVGGVEASIEG
jgi:hypothetical protein